MEADDRTPPVPLDALDEPVDVVLGVVDVVVADELVAAPVPAQ